MAITRRELITNIAKAGVPAAMAATVGAPIAHAETENYPLPSMAVGLLYDATKCIGCKACVIACSAANETPPDTRGDQLHQSPSDLNDLTRNIIKLYKPTDGSPGSFVKRQCMQCLDPACAAGVLFRRCIRTRKRASLPGKRKSALVAVIARSLVPITCPASSGWDSIRG